MVSLVTVAVFRAQRGCGRDGSPRLCDERHRDTGQVEAAKQSVAGHIVAIEELAVIRRDHVDRLVALTMASSLHTCGQARLRVPRQRRHRSSRIEVRCRHADAPDTPFRVARVRTPRRAGRILRKHIWLTNHNIRRTNCVAQTESRNVLNLADLTTENRCSR